MASCFLKVKNIFLMSIVIRFMDETLAPEYQTIITVQKITHYNENLNLVIFGYDIHVQEHVSCPLHMIW